ncbi:MAG: hypothetical protein GWN00_33625, partial [Aliifodinibius sp.]|nr:hypothetical protein [Fodinibius sp.]NIY29550.1 hypothetical protein [Fodinibius sp.]
VGSVGNIGYRELSGYIASNSTNNPDGKFYDAVYADGEGGIIDRRLSAYKDFTHTATGRHIRSGEARGLEGNAVTVKVNQVYGNDTTNLLGFYSADIGGYQDITGVSVQHNGVNARVLYSYVSSTITVLVLDRSIGRVLNSDILLPIKSINQNSG